MKTGNGIQMSQTRTALLAVIAVAAVVAAVSLYIGSGPQPDQASAESLNAPASASASAGYIKLGDIKGEATDDGHKEWINLLSVSQSITRPMSSGISGSTRQRGSTTFGDVVVVKELDKSSTKLQESIAMGQVIPFVELELASPAGAAGSSSEPYLRYELTNVQITNYRLSGAVSGDERPTESFSLNFEEIKVTYDELGSDGRSRGKVEYSWKIEEGTR